MTTVFLLVNQDNLLLERSSSWGYGNDLRALYKTPHRDEALNLKVELTVKDPLLRVRIEQAELDDRGLPRLADALLEKIPPRPPQAESNPDDNPADVPENSETDAPAQAELG